MALNVNGTVVKAVNINKNGVNTVLKKITVNNSTVVWQSGNTVTYKCNGSTYTEFVGYGQSCLSPTTFTPSKSGYTFQGWSISSTSTTVAPSVVMESSPITLYAVWKRNANGSMAVVASPGASFGVRSGRLLIGSFNATGYDTLYFAGSVNREVFSCGMNNNTSGSIDDMLYMKIGNSLYNLALLGSPRAGGQIVINATYNGASATISGNSVNVGGNANGIRFNIAALSGDVSVYVTTQQTEANSDWCGITGGYAYFYENGTLIAGKVVG